MVDNEADYDGSGRIEHTHLGLRNTGGAAALMLDIFPATEKILIAGCSAGGYGTLAAMPVIRLLFPEAHLYVLNESGPGLFDPSQIETWGTIWDVWGLEAAEYPDTFQRFFVQGSAHYVTDASYQVNGVSLYDWVEALVTDDPAWEDVLE
jgi:hypothetical protein